MKAKNSTLECSEKFKKTNFFIVMELILCFFVVYFTVTRKSAFASMCFSLSFIILLILLFKNMFVANLKNKEITNCLLLIMIVVIAFIAILYSNSLCFYSFEYFKKYLIFCSTSIFLFVVSRTEVNNKTVKFILITNIIMGTFYLYSYYFGVGRAYFNEYSSRYLTFNFSNPNLTAMWLLETILYIFIGMMFFKSKIIKLFCGALLAPMSYFLYETEARTCLIALAVYLALVLYTKFKKTIRFSKLTIIILILVPIITAFAYMFFINNESIRIFDFMESEGKTIDSRKMVWTFAFDAIKTHPIIGAYYQISYGTGMSQMHNTHVDVWASYGTIVFVLLMIYLIRIVISISEKCTSELQTISLMAFLISIIMGSGEAALFSGGQGIYILSCSFLLLARCNFNST